MALPMILGALASTGAGMLASRAQGKKAERAAEKAAGFINKIEVPTLEEARAQLESLVQQGVLTPEQAQAVLQDASAYSEIQEDPRLRATQIDALNDLSNVVDEGGMDARFRAALYDAGTQQAAESRGANEAIMANARARGIAGSNLESVNRLMAQQAAATRGAAQGVNAAAAAEERRMGALRDQSQLAGSLRDSDYRRASDEAAARDTINRFNTLARQTASNTNVQNANNAQAVNLGERQRIADANTTARNNVASELRELDFRKRQAQAQAALGVGAGQVADAQRGAAAGQGASQAVGTLFDSYLKSRQQDGGAQSGQLTSDERAKTDVQPFDSRQLLEDVSGVKFRYKDPADGGAGQMAGVMAQDVEKAAPGAVSERPDGTKQIDQGQLGGILLAALSDVHDRLKAGGL